MEAGGLRWVEGAIGPILLPQSGGRRVQRQQRCVALNGLFAFPHISVKTVSTGHQHGSPPRLVTYSTGNCALLSVCDFPSTSLVTRTRAIPPPDYLDLPEVGLSTQYVLHAA